MNEEYTFGSYIREKRQQAGLTVRDLAEHLDCSHAYVSVVETKRNKAFGKKSWKKLSEILDVNHEVLSILYDRSKNNILSLDKLQSLQEEAMNKEAKPGFGIFYDVNKDAIVEKKILPSEREE